MRVENEKILLACAAMSHEEENLEPKISSPPAVIRIKTHNGPFHADDVFGVLVLMLVIEAAGSQYEIIRSRDVAEPADFWVDVGFECDPARGRFDHHQEMGAGCRLTPNAEPYASFGLVWKEFGPALCSNNARIANLVDSHLVRHIDAVDCGRPTGAGYSISNAISSFNPCWNSETQNFDSAFLDACAFAKTLLEREINRATSMIKAIHRVRKSATKSRKQGLPPQILLLETFVPWKSVVNNEYPDVTFVVFPDTTGGWAVYCAPLATGSYRSKKLLPIHWGGMAGSLLDEETGIPGGTFCHRNRFVAFHSSQEGALGLAELALASAS